MDKQRKVLTLSTIAVERDAVDIDGVEYDLKASSDLSLLDQAEVQRFVKDMNRLDDSDDVEDISDAIHRIFRVVFYDEVPARVIEKLTNPQLEQMVDFFSERWQLRAPTETAPTTRET